MKIEHWRKDQSLVEWAHGITQQPQWKMLLQMLADEHPKNQRVVPTADAMIALGKIWGYDQALNLLDSIAMPPTVGNVFPESTFEAP